MLHRLTSAEHRFSTLGSFSNSLLSCFGFFCTVHADPKKQSGKVAMGHHEYFCCTASCACEYVEKHMASMPTHFECISVASSLMLLYELCDLSCRCRSFYLTANRHERSFRLAEKTKVHLSLYSPYEARRCDGIEVKNHQGHS
jgi:hypothetical protein